MADIAVAESAGPFGSGDMSSAFPDLCVVPDDTPAASERIPGGLPSREWLLEAHLRREDVHWRPGDSPQSEAAYQLVARQFPGFSYEVVNGWDPREKRVVPEEDRVVGLWCQVQGAIRSRYQWLTYERAFVNGEPREGVRPVTDNGDYICGPLSMGGVALKSFVKFEGYPVDADGNHYSMADLVRIAWGQLEAEVFRFSPAVRDRMGPVIAVGQEGSDYVQMLCGGKGDALLHLPRNPSVIQATADWVRAGAQGRPLTLVAPVCPDWSWERDASGNKRYTFARVNGGVGIVAERAIPAIAAFVRWAEMNHIDLRVLVAIGDFEGMSDETCERLSVTFEEFQRRCQMSLQKISEALSAVVPGLADRLETVLMTDLCGGVTGWQELLQEKVTKTQERGLASVLGIGEEQVRDIVAARTSLYERWYGPGVDGRRLLEAQLPEYGAMGAVALRHTAYPLMLGSCTRAMHVGFNLGQDRVLPGVSVRGSAY